MRSSVDRSTHRANAAANHGTAHGFAFNRAVVTLTDSTATADTNATTVSITTPVSVPLAEPYAKPDMQSAARTAVPGAVTETDTGPVHDRCLPCRKGRCVGCLWRTRWCGHDCPWLVADVIEHFPSLRAIALEENRMTQPVNDDDYADDAASVPDEDLPEPTDPSQVPPDEGDAGAVA